MTYNRDDVDRFLCDPSTWYLVDSPLSPPGDVRAATIFVSYPDRSRFKTFLKYSGGVLPHYLPVWSLKELKITAGLYSRDLDVVEKRYDLIGGIPRHVLEIPIAS